MKIRSLFLSLSTMPALFAAPDTVDPTFAASAGQVFASNEYGGVASSIVQVDGKVIFGSNEMPGTVGGMPLQIPLIRFNPDGTVDSTFGADNAPNGGGKGIVYFSTGFSEVHAMTLQADGKLIAAGVMEGYSDDGSTITHGGQSIVRFNIDGTPDATFTTRGTSASSGFNYLSDVEVQGDGKILAAGGFGGFRDSGGTFFNRKGLARLNSDGSVDPAFVLNPADFGASPFASGFVRDVEVGPGGEIYATVVFDFNAPSILCRLRPDGSRDFSFAPAYSGSFIQAINLDSAGRLLVVGRDAAATTPHVERFFPDGRKDSSFNFDTSLGLVSAEQLDESPTGQYYLADNGGSHLIRINENGSRDPGFDAGSDHPDGPGGPGSGNLRCFAISPDGSVYSGAFFSSVNGISTRKVVKFEGDQATPGTSVVTMSSVSASVVEGDRPLFLSATRTGDLSGAASATITKSGGTAGAGDFTSSAPFTLNWSSGVGGRQYFSINLLDDAVADGNQTIEFTLGGISGSTLGSRTGTTITIIDDEAVATIVSGPLDFTAVSGQDAIFSANVTSPTPATYQWQLNGVDIVGATRSSLIVPAIAPTLNGANITVVVTNGFGSITSPVATLTVSTPDGSRDFSFPMDLGGLGSVSQIVPLPNGSFILVPAAASPTGIATRLSLLRADGTVDFNFGPLFQNLSGNTQIERVMITSGGKIIVTGTFNAVSGVARDGIVRLTADGLVDLFFQAPGRPFTTAFVDSRGRVYTSFGNTGENAGLKRLLEDGNLDLSFQSNVGRTTNGGTIYAYAEDALGRIYVADFTSNNPRGFPVRLQRLLPNGGPDFSFSAPPLASLNTMTVLSDGRLALGSNNDLQILKVNGQRDFSFQISPQSVGIVTSILEEKGRLLVAGGGPFVRLLLSGQIDASFPPAGGGKVSSVIRLAGGRLLLAAGEATFNGGAVPSLFSVFSREPSIQFVAGSAKVYENSGTVDLTLRAIGDLSGGLSATVTSIDDTAIAGSHFAAVSETLGFDVANPERTISVTLTDDALANDTRQFSLRLTSPNLLYEADFQITILDDESAPVITQQPVDLIVPPGQTGMLTLSLDDSAGATIQWYQNGRTASQGTDFTYQPNTAGNYHAEVVRNGITVISDQVEVRFKLDGSAILSGFGFNAPLSQNPVKVVRTGPDGAAYVGAQSQPNGVGALTRVFPNATTDPAWAPLIFGTIYDLAVEPDGATVIAGALDIRDSSPVVTQIARYKNDGSRDSDFQVNVGSGPGVSGTIRVVARFANGDLLVGGNFSEWNGTALTSASSLVKLDASGNRITTFNADRSGIVTSAVPLDDGGALAIYQQDGTRVHRLDASGVTQVSQSLAGGLKKIVAIEGGKWLVVSTSNLSFNGASGTVGRLSSDLTLEQVFPITKAEIAAGQANGKVIVGGTFISNSRRKITRFLADGTPDPEFSTANGLRTFSENDGNLVTSLAGRADGSFWVGGTFPGYGPANVISHGNLALINGDPISLEIAGQPASRFVESDETVVLEAVVVSDLSLIYQWFRDGQLLSDGVGVSGALTPQLTLSPPVISGSYRLRVTGGPAMVETAPAFIGVLGLPEIRRISEDVTTASALPLLLQVEAYGTETLTYQWFRNGSPVAGQTSPLLNIPGAKVSQSGTYTLSIANDLGSITAGPIEVVVLQNGAAVVGGFTSPNVGGNINALLSLPGNRVLVGGDFFNFSNADFTIQGGRYLAAMQSDGTIVPDLGLGIDNRVQALARQSDGKIIVAGTFSQIGGESRKQVARLNADLTLDPAFDPGEVFPGFATVYSVAVDRDGKIMVVTTDTNTNYLVRLLPDGRRDPDFTVAPSSLIRDVIPQADGSYLVAGYFSNWDQTGGTTDSGLVLIANDGSLIATPDFETRSNRLNQLFQLGTGDLFAVYQDSTSEVLGADGLPVTDRFQGFTANSSINRLVESPEGLIYLGGFFTEVNGGPANRLVRTTAAGVPDPSFNVGTGFNNQVSALTLNDDGTIWVGGQFTQYNGSPANRLILLMGTAEPVQGRTFEDFMTNSGLPAGVSRFNDDPDRDGYSNGLEFLLGGNPSGNDPNLIPAPLLLAGDDLGLGDGLDYLTLQISIADDLVDLPWAVEASTNLTFDGGDPEAAVQVGDPVVANGLATYLFRCPWSVQDARGRGFLRLSLASDNQ